MADQPFTEVVRDHGRQTAQQAAEAAIVWRTWGDQLDELARHIPAYYQPEVYDETKDREPVELPYVSRSDVRAELYRILALVDGYAAGLDRAAAFVVARSEELSAEFAIDGGETRD